MQRDSKIQFFNILRFIGAFIIAVFLHWNDHFLPCLGIANPFPDGSVLGFVSRKSYVFVEMYFIISGFLFSKVYIRKIEKGLGFDEFFIRRMIRVCPLVVITSVVMYVGNCVLYKINHTLWSCGTLSLNELLTDILFSGKAVICGANTLNGPIWYISVLLFCYILAYILTKLSQKFGSEMIFAIPIIAGFMIQYSGRNTVIWNMSAARGYISFFLGVLLEKYLKYFDRCGQKSKIAIRTVAGGCLVVSLMLEVISFGEMMIGNRTNYYTFYVFLPLMILFYDCHWVNRLCDNVVFEWLGKVSFGIYLWNFPIYLLLHILFTLGYIRIDVTGMGFFVINAVLHLMIAAVSYYFIDAWLCKKMILKYNSAINRK